MTTKKIVKAIEHQHVTDRLADPLQGAVKGALDRVPAVRKALHGNWLGHSLHAALTDIPIGAWTSGVLLDIRSASDRRYRVAADAVHAIGMVGALGAALTGLTDWTYVHGQARRLGFVHGAANFVIAGLFGGSLLARSRGRRKTGVTLSGIGYALTVVSAWLGGELTYTEGANVGAWPSPREQPSQQRIAEPAIEST